ncbi:putative leucine-rich repeat domain, L domain-containing protein [Medicago truncatula]|uniref:F-box/LRR protein n=1 Tax=Medicago truncatula TaxID=3880 RepID=A0A072VRT3_MEDTR|nr:F-box/LRR-repeat protein 2 [Medicago truncatula]KEH44482.1 F-box/LRR protein [Medicago truncatula]RHN82704.1 putative leucine-rich repeat domain, L domain-containing protein [Medicago truncatula]
MQIYCHWHFQNSVRLISQVITTYSLLFHICKNFEFLEEIILFDCNYLTNIGIASAICERPNLKSFSISFCKIRENQRMYVSSKMISSLRNLKGLTCLDLSSARISDHLLSSLAEQGLPLKRLSLKNSMDYSYAGIFCLLSKCQFLQHLDLQYSFYLNDQDIVGLSLVLGNLVSINLSPCTNITELTLVSLVRNCPFLSEIRSGIGKFCDKNCNCLMDFVVYPQVKSLHLAGNPRLKNESIKMLPSLFPNLQGLDLRMRYCHCYCISEGIVEVLRCCKITHLNLRSWSTLNLLSMNFQVSKLEVLNLAKTKIDDDTLYVISKSFCGLLQLDLERCDHITEKGVRHVVKTAHD